MLSHFDPVVIPITPIVIPITRLSFRSPDCHSERSEESAVPRNHEDACRPSSVFPSASQRSLRLRI
jgi:hypothetical protein